MNLSGYLVFNTPMITHGATRYARPRAAEFVVDLEGSPLQNCVVLSVGSPLEAWRPVKLAASRYL